MKDNRNYGKGNVDLYYSLMEKVDRNFLTVSPEKIIIGDDFGTSVWYHFDRDGRLRKHYFEEKSIVGKEDELDITLIRHVDVYTSEISSFLRMKIESLMSNMFGLFPDSVFADKDLENRINGDIADIFAAGPPRKQR